MKNEDTKDLVNRILAGSPKAFRQFVDNYKKLVAHIVFRLVPKASDREDLCQEVFLKIYQNLHDFKFESKLSTWVAKIAYNTSINFLEKKKVPLYEDFSPEDMTLDHLAGSGSLPDKIIENKDINRLLRLEIDNLPIKYRTIVTLYHLEEMSYTEIGQIVGWPEGTVKNYLFRARKYLKDVLVSKYQLEELYK